MTENNFFSRIRIPLLLCMFLTIHSFAMNGHSHVYRELNIGTYVDPIIAKADPSFFKNSLYVQAVKRTGVRLSLFYDASDFIVNNFDFETFIIIQECISLFFMLGGIVALTKVLFGNFLTGYAAALLYTLELNNWTLGSPAPYLNFFHHGLPYAYPLTLWSLVFFLTKRYTVAFLLAGAAWNFHPMCTVFLLCAYGLYVIVNYRKFKAATILYCAGAFILPALPMLVRSFSYLGNTSTVDMSVWLTVARWAAWYTCFPSTWLPLWFIRAGLFGALFLIALYTVPDRSPRRDIMIFITAVGILCLIGTIIPAVYPLPFIIKLSLWRSTIIYLFLALACVAYFLVNLYNTDGIAKRFLVIAIMVLITGYLKCFKLYYFPFFIVFLIYAFLEQRIVKQFPVLKGKFSWLFFTGLAVLFCAGTYREHFLRQSIHLGLFFCFTLAFLLIIQYFERRRGGRWTSNTAWTITLAALFIILFDCAVLYSRDGPTIYYRGKIWGRVDPWAQMQLVARRLSSKDDLFIVPPYMNDFGIYSRRATLGDWAEGANALYLDNRFAQEWYQRMNDLGWKELHGEFDGYNRLSTADIEQVAKKYGAKFVISEKPKTFMLQKLYENEKFILYRSGTADTR
jgi:hypothetical protein